MNFILIREPNINDKAAFLSAMQRSESFHHPWVNAPTTAQSFDEHLQRYQQDNQKSYLVINHAGDITGVINISEIVRGIFQNAYLGFYGVVDFANKGHMHAGLQLVLKKAFDELGLHRIEANIQPNNISSKNLVKRLGFRFEGCSPRYLYLNGEWRDHEHWAMTLEDYQLIDSLNNK